MMGTRFDVDGNTLNARRKLAQLERRVQNPERAWRSVGAYLSREVQKQFTTRGANFGTPWKPLAPSTIRQKRRSGFSRQMLVRTGEMKRTFTARPMQIEIYAKNMATFGSASMKALWQQDGTFRHGRRHIPPRTILKLTPKVKREIRNILARYITKGM